MDAINKLFSMQKETTKVDAIVLAFNQIPHMVMLGHLLMWLAIKTSKLHLKRYSNSCLPWWKFLGRFKEVAIDIDNKVRQQQACDQGY